MIFGVCKMIRFIIGFLVMLGASSLTDVEPTVSLLNIFGLAVLGISLMASGTIALRKKEFENN
jgi:hypothetical protein